MLQQRRRVGGLAPPVRERGRRHASNARTHNTPTRPCCSRTFQRFAIRSSSMVEDLAKKTAEQKGQVAARGGEAFQQGSEFFRVFREEVRGTKKGRGGRARGAAVRP